MEAKTDSKSLLVILLLLVAWEVLSRAGVLYTHYFPPVSSIFLTFLRLTTQPSFLVSIGSTLNHMFLGFLLAAGAGIPAGLILGSFEPLYKLFKPLVELLRPLPSVAIIPIAIVIFGVGSAMRVVVIAFGSFWPILINTIEGVMAVEPRLIQTGKVFGLERKDLIAKIIFPSASPYIVSGLKISSAIALILVITSEMIGGQEGIGYFIHHSQMSFRIPEMYAGVMTIAILGYLIAKFFVYLEKRMMAWHKDKRSSI